MQVGRPQVIDKIVDGKTLTPYEQVVISVPDNLSGIVIQKLGARFGVMQHAFARRQTALEFYSTRGLLVIVVNLLLIHGA